MKYNINRYVTSELKAIDKKSRSAFFKSAKGVIKGGWKKFDAITGNYTINNKPVLKLGKVYKRGKNMISLGVIASNKRIPADHFTLIPSNSNTTGNKRTTVGYKFLGQNILIEDGFIWNEKLFRRKTTRGLPIERVFATSSTADLLNKNYDAVLNEMIRIFNTNFNAGQ